MWALACVMGTAIVNACDGLREGDRHGPSIAPIIPFFPLAFWGIAKLIDLAIDPWGTRVIGGFHAALLVIFTASFLCGLRKLRSIDAAKDSRADQ